MTSVDNTDQCPLFDHCATCGHPDDLAVGTIETAVGVYCVTLCGDCAGSGRLPRQAGWAATLDLVARHCEHLGINVDQMAAMLAAEPAD